MRTYNFKPNYEKWWNHPEVNEGCMIMLIMGVDPADVRKVLDLQEKKKNTRQEYLYLSAFDNYLRQDLKQPFFNHFFFYYMEKGFWDGSKEGFIRNAYNAGTAFPAEFMSFLRKKGVIPDHKPYALYKRPIEQNLNLLDRVSNTMMALSFMMGLNSYHLIQFCLIRQKMSGPDNIEELTKPHREFRREYAEFLNAVFPHLDHKGEQIFNLCMMALARIEWKGNLPNFVHDLHNAGIRLHPDIYTDIEKHCDIRPSYSETGWAAQFYKSQCKEKVWSIPRAARLFRGMDPFIIDGRCFVDASQETRLFYINEAGVIMGSDRSGQPSFCVNECLYNDKAIKPIKIDSLHGPYYEAIEITSWFLRTTGYRPPSIMLDTLRC